MKDYFNMKIEQFEMEISRENKDPFSCFCHNVFREGMLPLFVPSRFQAVREHIIGVKAAKFEGRVRA